MKKSSQSNKSRPKAGYRIRQQQQDSRISNQTQHNNLSVLVFLVTVGALIGLMFYAGFSKVTDESFIETNLNQLTSFINSLEELEQTEPESSSKFGKRSTQLVSNSTSSVVTTINGRTTYTNQTYEFSLELPKNTEVEARSRPEYSFVRFMNYQPSLGGGNQLNQDEFYLELYIYPDYESTKWLTDCSNQVVNPAPIVHDYITGIKGAKPTENVLYNPEHVWCFTLNDVAIEAVAGESYQDFPLSNQVIESLTVN